MTRTRKIVLGAGSALVLAGTGAALASAGSGHHRPAAAPRGSRPIGVSFASRSGPAGAGPGLFRAGGPLGPAGTRPLCGPRLGLRAAADYLQIPISALVADLRSGETLAQVADSTSGKSASGLIQFLVGKAKAALDDAVSAGRLGRSQADAIAATVQERVTALVDGTIPERPAPGLRGGFGLGRRGGPEAAADYLQALVTREKAAVADAVKAGRLTQARAHAITANLEQRITALVDGTLPRPAAPFGFGFGPGPYHRWHEHEGESHGVGA